MVVVSSTVSAAGTEYLCQSEETFFFLNLHSCCPLPP